MNTPTATRRGLVVDAYIALVVAVGALLLVSASLDAHPSTIDPVMFLMVMALAGIAQRNPVTLFRASAISVAFAVKIAAYVLFGTAVALWATIVVVAVNAYTPQPKPARKILSTSGNSRSRRTSRRRSIAPSAARCRRARSCRR